MYNGLVALLVLAVTHCGVSGCEQNEFFNLKTHQCQRCSECGESLLLRLRVCSGTNDTLCGLADFSFLGNTGDERPVEVTTPSILVDDEERYWKNLAFALIVLLSVLVMVTTVIVLVTCYRFRNSGWFCKVVAHEQDDAENGYVVIHKFIPDAETLYSAEPSGSSPHTSPELPRTVTTKQQRRYRPYRPKRRLMTEFVDDVFESDDSSGSRTLRLPLETIPEKSEGS